MQKTNVFKKLLQIVANNVCEEEINTVEIVNNETDDSGYYNIINEINNTSRIKYARYSKMNISKDKCNFQMNIDLLLVSNSCNDKKVSFLYYFIK